MDALIPADPLQIDLPDADVSLWLQPDLGEDAALLRDRLVAETPWRQDSIVLFGKRHQQPRLVAWYGDAGAAYRYSGLQLEPLPWTELLQELRLRVQDLCQASFNSVLLNYYRDHRDSMGMHADDEPELGEQPVIASLSLGETRTMVFRHRQRKELKPVRLALPGGSLLLMQGATQRCWKHGIDKRRQPCDARVNLTFRRILC